MENEVIEADFRDPEQAKHIGELMDCYSSDPSGGGSPISEDIKSRLATELSKVPGAFSILCYVEGLPAGLVNCLPGFSTFKCKPLINIHDVVVAPEYRGLGISQLLLAKVEEVARERGCCKLTLEVLEGNKVAQNSYLKFGFAGYELNPAMGMAFFWEKSL
mgnify:CR=1 FL=1|jgi:GNAT superfamily N-acetyltransferase